MHASTTPTSVKPCAVFTDAASKPATAQSKLMSSARSITAPTTTPPCTLAGESPSPMRAMLMQNMYRNARE